MKTPTSQFSFEEISEQLNRAANDVVDATGMGETGAVDAVNLVVNAALHYLERPGASLAEAVEVQYGGDVTLDDVAGWIAGD